jgi:hypothetical protein
MCVSHAFSHSHDSLATTIVGHGPLELCRSYRNFEGGFLQSDGVSDAPPKSIAPLETLPE